MVTGEEVVLPNDLPGFHGESYCQVTARNVSLGRLGRKLFLCLLSLNTGLLAIASALMGAWPVLPYAGLELACVAYAFYYLGQFDGDYERLTIAGGSVNLDSCQRGALVQHQFNRMWVTLTCLRRGQRCQLALLYKGKTYSLGRLMSDEQRVAWSRELEQQLRSATA